MPVQADVVPIAPDSPKVRNVRLKVAVIEDGRHGYEVATAAHLHPNVFSRIISGSLQPSAGARKRIAQVLNRPESELFEDA